MAASSERSPSTIRQPSSRSSPALDGVRTRATTSSPRSRSLRARCPPMKPVPPVTNAFTRRDSIREIAAPHAYTGRVERSRNGRAAESRYGEGIRNPRARQRALLIAAGPNEIDLTELRELLRTAGVAVAGELVQRRSSPDPDRYFGRGKLADLKRAIAESDANLVACDDELLPRQERNLEEEVGVPVIDRAAIIL